MTIQWDPTQMATGNPTIDSEHQEWIRRFNDYENAVVSGQGIEAVTKLLEYMSEYSESHFVHEEMLAGDEDTPEIKLNHAEHNKFRANVLDMKQWIKQNGVTNVEVISLKIDLETWLVHHICNVDVKIWKK